MDVPRLSLAQQIAQLDVATPMDLDPEDVHVYDIEGQGRLSIDPAAREHYVDVRPSTLRKLYDGSVSDPKYDGIKATRKQLMEESEDGGMSEDESEGSQEGETSDVGKGTGVSGGRRSEHETNSVDGGENFPTKKSLAQPLATSPEPIEDLSSVLQIKREEDRKKGKAVSRQIAIWDNLLDARIRLQKTVVATNKLPVSADLQLYSALPECQHVMKKMLEEAAALSDELFELQEHFLTSNGSVNLPPRKRRKIDPTYSSAEYATYFQDATESVCALEAAYHPFLVQTLSKWSSKIQATAPSVLLPSNRNAFSAKGPQNLKSVVQLIDETLGDSSKLLARTRVRRGKGNRLGISEEVTENEDSSIFDDTDFYQQLLRDVIDARGNSNKGDDDWMVVQKQKKAKKKVDTKASKGRKIRYEVHEKLQNFMVPVPVVGAWHEEQTDELFASLLGRGFSISEKSDGKEETGKRNELEEQLGEALQDGYRVFG